MKNFKSSEINSPFFQLHYYRRFYTGRHFRVYFEKLGILFRIGWNPYENSRALIIFIGYSWADHKTKRIQRMIKRSPSRFLKTLEALNEST